jgi:ParB-like chromosome segregation protein Spo0J
LLKKSKIPAIIEIINPDNIILSQIVENIQRLEMKPFELALAYTEAIKKKRIKANKLAELLGKHKAEISRDMSILKLLKFNDDIRFFEGINKENLIELARIIDKDYFEKALNIAKTGAKRTEIRSLITTEESAGKKGDQGSPSPQFEVYKSDKVNVEDKSFNINIKFDSSFKSHFSKKSVDSINDQIKNVFEHLSKNFKGEADIKFNITITKPTQKNLKS